MPQITEPLLVPIFASTKKWRLAEPYIYKTKFVDGMGYDIELTLTIPKGFKTDLASTPRFLWSIFPPFGEYTGASIIHDYLYRYARTMHGANITRKVADKIFLIIMKEMKVPLWKRQLMYWGVRIFGDKFFIKGE